MSVTKVTTSESFLSFVLAVSLLLFAAATMAQSSAQSNPGTQEKVAALKEAVTQNQAALKTYMWTEGTEISLKGEVKKREQKECRYGPDGKVQKTAVPSGDEGQQKQAKGGGGKGGVVKKAIVKEKVDDLKDYMEKAAAVVHEYVPPDPQKIQAAAAAGKISTQPASSGGLTMMTITDYAKPGDKLALGFDPTAKK